MSVFKKGNKYVYDKIINKGKPNQVRVWNFTGFKTKKEAEEAEKEHLRRKKIELGMMSEGDIDITLEELIKIYYEDFSANNAISSAGNLKRRLKIYFLLETDRQDIKELFKQPLPLKEDIKNLTINDIKTWQNQVKQIKHANISYINDKILAVMRRILDFGILYGVNPKLPKAITKINRVDNNKMIRNYNDDEKIKHKIKQKNFWDINEYYQFRSKIDEAGDKLWKLGFDFLYFTGVRNSEFRTVKWGDFNAEKKYVYINRNIASDRDTEKYSAQDERLIGPPKSERGFRYVDLPSWLVEKLNAYKNELINNGTYDINNYIFFNNKAPMGKDTIRKNLVKYIEKSGVKKIKVHEFRHSRASMLIASGCSMQYVAEQLGDTMEVISRVYVHLWDQIREEDRKKANLQSKREYLEKYHIYANIDPNEDEPFDFDGDEDFFNYLINKYEIYDF